MTISAVGFFATGRLRFGGQNTTPQPVKKSDLERNEETFELFRERMREKREGMKPEARMGFHFDLMALEKGKGTIYVDRAKYKQAKDMLDRVSGTGVFRTINNNPLHNEFGFSDGKGTTITLTLLPKPS